MKILYFIYYKILLNQVVLSLISGFIGALVAGGFTWWATKQAHEHNRQLKEEELKISEKSTVLSIIGELKTLKKAYEKEMDEYFNDLDRENDDSERFLTSSYTITQNFMTVYENNSDKLGLISKEEIRIGIIEAYTILKRFIENLINYKDCYHEFDSNRDKFISMMYPHLINGECSKANNDAEIQLIVDRANKDEWDKIDTSNISRIKIKTFLQSDKRKQEELIFLSRLLKEEYLELKKNFDNVIFTTKNFYEDK